MPASPLHISRCESLWHEDHCPECGAEAEAAQQAAPLDALIAALYEEADKSRDESMRLPNPLASGAAGRAGGIKFAIGKIKEYARLAPAQARPADAAPREALELLRRVMGWVTAFGFTVNDNACRECVPESPILVDGWLCAIHAARAALAHEAELP